MAAGKATWGIDIGQCSLKALKCSLGSDGETMVAEAFDYVEYPKILSQPDADPEVLVREALKQFLARNSVRGNKVAVSVSGQSGLARFIKLPPVEAKKISEIVKYEAKQQIPFALEDVVWDYQTLQTGVQTEGVALETEVGLFAMKRDQVFRVIQPLDDAGIELDVVQLTPLAIYNAVVHGVLTELPSPADYDPENPPDSLVVLSLGTDTSDLVVTNGFKVWQRSIPMGGNHFTKQLTKELKLTFANAELQKRNSRQAEDPKTLFQAMRPVFSDLVTEVQRSIGFFQSLDRDAKISRILVMGNTIKLPGLQQYLEKNLGLAVGKLESFGKLTGSSVVTAPAFRENLASFPVSYGLCLQGLGKAKLRTNLVPRELVRARLIRLKKPWAVGAVALLLAALCLSFLFHWSRWSDVHPDYYANAFNSAERIKSKSQAFQRDDKKQLEEFESLKDLGNEVVGNADGRLLMLELLKVINTALPIEMDKTPEEVSKLPFEQRPEMHIKYIESQYFPDLAEGWFASIKGKYIDDRKSTLKAELVDSVEENGETADETDEEPSEEEIAEEEAVEDEAVEDEAEELSFDEDNLVPPEGPGWVIEINGQHYFRGDSRNRGGQYVRNTLLKKLEDANVELPGGPGKKAYIFSMKDLGISYPVLIESKRRKVSIPNPNYVAKSNDGVPSAGQNEPQAKPFEDVQVCNFTVQFCWQEIRASQRLEKRERELAVDNAAADDLAGNQ